MENNSSDLNVSKQFECSKEILYSAWTQSEQLKQWWKPMGKLLTDVVNDIKEGGEIKYVFENGSLTIDGTYEKVQGHDLLEYTWNWHLPSEPVQDAAYKLSVQFAGDDNSSTISVTQTGFETEEHVQPHKQGWEQGLQQLNDYLTGSNKAGTAANNSGETADTEEAEKKFMPPVTGYNETPEQAKVAGG